MSLNELNGSWGKKNWKTVSWNEKHKIVSGITETRYLTTEDLSIHLQEGWAGKER